MDKDKLAYLHRVLNVLVGGPPREVADVDLVLPPGVLRLRPLARRGGLLVLDGGGAVARRGGGGCAGRQDVVVEVVARVGRGAATGTVCR